MYSTRLMATSKLHAGTVGKKLQPASLQSSLLQGHPLINVSACTSLTPLVGQCLFLCLDALLPLSQDSIKISCAFLIIQPIDEWEECSFV